MAQRKQMWLEQEEIFRDLFVRKHAYARGAASLAIISPPILSVVLEQRQGRIASIAARHAPGRGGTDADGAWGGGVHAAKGAGFLETMAVCYYY